MKENEHRNKCEKEIKELNAQLISVVEKYDELSSGRYMIESSLPAGVSRITYPLSIGKQKLEKEFTLARDNPIGTCLDSDFKNELAKFPIQKTDAKLVDSKDNKKEIERLEEALIIAKKESEDKDGDLKICKQTLMKSDNEILNLKRMLDIERIEKEEIKRNYDKKLMIESKRYNEALENIKFNRHKLNNKNKELEEIHKRYLELEIRERSAHNRIEEFNDIIKNRSIIQRPEIKESNGTKNILGNKNTIIKSLQELDFKDIPLKQKNLNIEIEKQDVIYKLMHRKAL